MKILVVSHDAGGAAIVSAWIAVNHIHQYDLLLFGPARDIFSDCVTLENVTLLRSEEEIKWQKYDFLLTSTSWGSDIEKKYILLAQKNKVRSASYLDHWANYRERFYLEGQWVFPNEIWVGDSPAQELANKVFCRDEVSIRFVENEYVKLLLKKASRNQRRIQDSGQLRKILYLCEPILEHCSNNKFGLNEFEILDRFLFLLSCGCSYCEIQVVIRRHPSEAKNKYQQNVFHYAEEIKVKFSRDDLLTDCLWANEVVGISSMGMMIANQLGKKVLKVPEMDSSLYYTLPVNFPIFCG